MKTIIELLSNEKTTNLSAHLEHPEEVLFFDIETTGFSPKTSCVYLIGACTFQNSSWQLTQWFAENPSEEKEMLHAFQEFAAAYKKWIHFNGTTFDIPFLQARCKKKCLPELKVPFSEDIFRCISPYKNLLHLPGCKQRNLEQFLDLYREDPFTGGQLIELYRIYSAEPDERLLKTLLLHNAEDLSGMLAIYPVTAYQRIFQSALTVSDAEWNTYRTNSGAEAAELLLTLKLPALLPKPLAFHSSDTHSFPDETGCFFSARDNIGILKIPCYAGELKYFFPDYKNYAYLPAEDKAIHKSVAIYVDKAFRKPATAATCYERKSGSFLPFPASLSADEHSGWHNYVFRRELKDKNLFFLPDEDFLQNMEKLADYAAAVLHHMTGLHL